MRKRKSLLTMSERMFTPVYLLGQSERVIRQYWDRQKSSEQPQRKTYWQRVAELEKQLSKKEI